MGPAMSVKLYIKPAESSPFDFEFSTNSLVIGRSRQCDLIVADRFLSRKHARIFKEGDRWHFEDLGSQNGSQLNGRSSKGAEPLEPGSHIQVSDSYINVVSIDGRGEPVKHRMDSIFIEAATILDRDVDELLGVESSSRRYVDHLKLLNEVHQALAESITKDALLKMILEKVFVYLQPEEACIFLKDEEGALHSAAHKNLPGRIHAFFESKRLAEEVAGKGMAALVHDVNQDERFSAADSIIASGVRSLVAAPLLGSDSQTLGMIVMSSRWAVRQFTEEDLALLVSLASVATLRIRNIDLAEEAAQSRRLEEELALARHIQKALLPRDLPNTDNFSIFAENHPSRGVSGDLYQVLERLLDGQRELVFFLADVSGKGMSASLLTASLEALSSGPIEDGLPPQSIFNKLSKMLYRRTPPERYATAFLAILNPQTGRVQYTNAGHNPALLIRTGDQVEPLGLTGVPLGLLPGETYTAEEFVMKPGDLLAIYTDGITEASNADEEEFGVERLQKRCILHRHEPLEDLAGAIKFDLERFAGQKSFTDDRTLILLRRNR